MFSVREWWNRLRSTVRPTRRDDDLERELQAHLELAAEDERAHGRTPDDARRTAAVRVGTVAPAMEALRDQRHLPWMNDAGRDIRYAGRALVRNPAFTAVVLLTLAIGIGANATVFTLVNSVVLKPLPYPKSNELVAIWHTAPGAAGLASVSGDLRLSASMFFTYAEHNKTFAHLGIWYPGTATVTGVAEPEQVPTLVVTQGILEALAVQPLVGRWLAPADQAPDGARTALLSYGYWQRRLGGDPSVVGRTIVIDALPREIVGVMPSGFRIMDTDADILMPARFDRRQLILAGFGFRGLARLTPGVTINEANADIARMVPIWMGSWPAAAGVSPRVYESWRITPALRPLKDDVVGSAARTLTILMGSLGIVLLVACANVATLLLVRAEGRQQELAIRVALGAGTARIVRGVLIESGLLALVGGLLGLGVANLGVQLLVAYGPSDLPRASEIAIDLNVLAVTLATSILCGILFGLVPAVKYAAPRIAGALGTSGRTLSESRERRRVRDILVVAQLALALVLLISAGLMIRSAVALRAVHPGFEEPERLQAIRIAIPGSLVREAEQVARMQQAILDKLRGLSGVEAVAFASEVPLEGVPTDWDALLVEGQPFDEKATPALRTFKRVSPAFFEVMGTRVIAGRSYTWDDCYGRRPYVVVSENLARELWGSPERALGKRVRTLPNAPWYEVIGVVQDVHDSGLDQPPPTIAYWPTLGASLYRAGQSSITRTATFVIRGSRAGTEGFVREVQRAVWSVNANLSFPSMRTMREIYGQSMARTSFTLVMVAIAGCMAMALGIIGVYGVVSYAVSQRRREIGIRVALGAGRTSLTGLFVKSGLVLATVGIPIGLLAAALLTRTMAALLFGVSALDPITFVTVPAILVTAAVLASYLPARRAASVNPVEALKAQ